MALCIVSPPAVRTLALNTMRRRLAHVPVLPDRVLIRPLALRMARVTHTVPTIVRRTLRPVTRPWR